MCRPFHGCESDHRLPSQVADHIVHPDPTATCPFQDATLTLACNVPSSTHVPSKNADLGVCPFQKGQFNDVPMAFLIVVSGHA